MSGGIKKWGNGNFEMGGAYLQVPKSGGDMPPCPQNISMDHSYTLPI